jgi:predicted acetyltransferase
MTAPNLRYGIPFLFHRWLNTRSFRQHVLQSIDPMGWGDTISAEGFEVLFAGYCGGPDLWQSGEQTKWQQLISKLIIGFLQLLKRLFFVQKLASMNNKFLSSDIMVIGKKKTR